MKKPNLLVIGASGGVARAFLRSLVHHRNFFGNLVLLDRGREVLADPYIDHPALRFVFVQKRLRLPEEEKVYHRLLRKYHTNIVLDLTDMDSIPILEATDRAGVSYVNTALNDDRKLVSQLAFEVFAKRKQMRHARHILCTGMNPGIVNMWVRYGIEKFGIPKEVVHFEYDSSMSAKKWRLMSSWSLHEFLVENVRDPSGFVLGKGKVKQLFPNALEHRVPLKSVLQPILPLERYPEGFLVLHEENLSIAEKYNIPSKFIYAIHMETMKALVQLYEKKKRVREGDLILGDNTQRLLDGSDSIGVLLEYKDKRVYYFNSVPNIAVIGTNATYTQVVVGIFSALFTLLFDRLAKGVYFVEDLFDTHFKYYMFDNMRVQEFVFRKGKTLKILHYNPGIVLKRKNRFQHMYM